MSNKEKQFMDINFKEEAKKEFEELPLSLQIMHELKLSSQRWFIISIAELIVIVVILLFVFVIPVDEYSSITQTLDTDDSSNITQTMGE